MTRRSMPYHRRYHQDAMNGYRTLTLEQRGAFQTIQDLIYDEFGPIENNERWLAGQLNCSIRKCRALVSELLSLRKIYITTQGKISNRRCEAEISNSLEISRKRAENGSKRPSKVTDHSKIPSENNGGGQQKLGKSAVIPVPVPDYNNTDGSVVEDAQPDGADNSRLADQLRRSREAQPGHRYAVVSASLRKH